MAETIQTCVQHVQLTVTVNKELQRLYS